MAHGLREGRAWNRDQISEWQADQENRQPRFPMIFGRTAVRNLERAGVSRSDAMKMVGHKTESIYRRYAISDERSMRESAGKLDKFHAADQRQQNSK